MIEQLFGSKTRVKLLQLFYSNPNRSFYVREITRKIDEQINSVRRELSNMLSIGIISSETNNNKLYYEVNQDYEFYDPLLLMFGSGSKKKAGSKGVGSDNVSRMKALGNVDLAFLTGQFTRDETSGVDVLIVGDINKTQLEKYITELEEQEGKDIRFTVMTPDELKYRQQINDRFISHAMAAKKQVIIDKHDMLREKDSAESDQPTEESTKKEK
ncbi:MAG: transcriptional regulator [Actinobacteria bacterium]|nr:transcriptional regulator [Actinomycetota bacterium]